MPKDNNGQMAAVQVALRIRPLTERDRAQPRFAGDVLRAHEQSVQIVSQNKYFTYDHVFGPNSQQSDIFESLGEGPVQKFVEGYNVTMLAYGQTSSGKTYTMGTAQHTNDIDLEHEGIVPRAMALLFELLEQQNDPRSPVSAASSVSDTNKIQARSKKANRSSVKVSFVEIYNEELIDLLNSAPPNEKPPVTIREDTKGHIYWTGTENRATGSTDMNEKSSRSHAIFSVTLKQERYVPSSPNSSRAASPVASKLQSKRVASNANRIPDDGDWIITTSKFHFVDLAGSERLKRTAAEGDRRKEGININAGLLALGNVISALGDPSKRSTHVPYRDSKLTRLLQDSLGGSAMTLMIACVSPAESNLSETLNTLQYANRARNIKNKMEKNEMEEWMTTDNLELLRSTIAKLKGELKKGPKRVLADLHDESTPMGNPDFDDLYHEQHVTIAELQQQVEELQAAAEFIKQRNVMVEDELVRVHQEKSNQPSDLDFQHLVEPVIEEYEKSISGLESQLAMIRAALSHSDHAYDEQQLKIDQCEVVIESQEQTINELRRRVQKLLERQIKDETYTSELEKKLMTTVEETVHDRELLSELRGKILKLKEVDENTEHYIHDLETRLATSESERKALKEKMDSLQSQKIDDDEDKSIEKEELKTLRDKCDKYEEEKQKLQHQIDDLLKAATTTTETKEPPIPESNDQHERMEALEADFKHLQQDHQDTLKELDEVLLRYQESLDQVDALQSKYSNDAAPQSGGNGGVLEAEKEIHILRESVQHLEQELENASRREMIFRQMSEEHTESMQVENTLKTLEIPQENDLKLLQHDFAILQQKYNELKKSEIENQTNESDTDCTSKRAMTELHAEYESLFIQYKRELKTLTRIIKDVKRLKGAEIKAPETSPEHKVLIKSIAGLDKQLTEHYDRVKLEAKRFSNEVNEMVTLSSGLEKELEQESEGEEENQLPSPSGSELIFQYEKNRNALQVRLAIARQDLKTHRTVITALENKFKNAESVLSVCKQRIENGISVTDVEIEDLMLKMDAMKIRLENNERQERKPLAGDSL
ncbi:kinesin-domain-containing protein [Backusella circina FSU 941]|nr:kinesin-domain-containing protein [Backusella circina FSU 941]